MSRWLPRLSPALAVLLCAVLSLSPALSWYAYADQSYEGQEVEHGGEDYRGTRSADESGAGGAQPQDGGEVGSGAAAREAQKAVFSEAASSGLSALGGGVSPVLDGSSENPNLYRPGSGDDSRPDELGANDGERSDEFGGDSVGADSISESGISTDGSSSSFDGNSNLLDENLSNFETEITPRAIPAVPVTILKALEWIGVATSTAAAVDTFISWFSGPSKDIRALEAITAATAADFEVNRRNLSYSQLSYELLSWIDEYTRLTYYRFDDVMALLRQQWGYNYGSGGTVIYSANSPAGWLQKLKEYNVNEYYDGYTYSTAKYLAFIFREMERANAKLNYNGSLVGGDPADYSAARLLARVHNALYGNITYAETGNGGVRSAVSVLGYIANLIYYGNNDLAMVAGRNLYHGSLNGVAETDQYFSTARLLARLNNLNNQEVTLHETGTTAYRSSAGLLGYIANLTYDTSYSMGKYLETGTAGKRSLSDIALYSANLVYDSSYSHGELLETGTSGKRSLADLLRYTANLVYLLRGDVSTLGDLMKADSSFFAKGFADVLSRLDLLHEDMGAGISVDTSGIESKLEKIAGLLLAAGVIENGKDLFDAVFGDLSGIGQAAATGAIQSAMEDVFPFCVPALVKQVFGLLVFEGSAPVWEFDICGHPLVCDFTGFQLVADCTSWLSRLGFVLALLVNTRKFVFTVNGGGSS